MPKIINRQRHHRLTKFCAILTILTICTLLWGNPAAEAQTPKMYWTSERGINRAETNGAGRETVIPVTLVDLQYIALDAVAGKIYWTDLGLGVIKRSNLNGSTLEELVTGLSVPQGIALDVAAGKMYWADFGTEKIQRANLDGTVVEDVVATGLARPSGIALDVAGRKVYWGEFGTIRRSDLDGTGTEDLVPASNPLGIALDLTNGKMYWADDGADKIQRANLDGTVPEDLVVTGLFRPSDIALDTAAGKMYWTDFGADTVQRSNLDGTVVQELVTGLDVPRSLAVDPAGGKMYWADVGAHKIQRSNLDGTVIEDVVTTVLANPEGIALDVAAGKMYWTDRDTGKIQRSNLDGSGVEDLVPGLLGPFSIALDVAAGKMYWIDGGMTHRANLDGSGAENLIGVTGFSGIALDTAGGKIYSTNSSGQRINRANLDGSGAESFLTGLGFTRGIAIDVAAGKVYWTDTSGNGNVWRANLDRSGVENLVSTAGSARGIALDVAGGKMYWMDTAFDRIQRANLDGSSVEELATDLFGSEFIALDIRPPTIYTQDIILAQGLNMIPLPLKPSTSFDARGFTNLIETGAPTTPLVSVVIKYDTALGSFVAFLPAIPNATGFPIEGGEGYIVNVMQTHTVTFTGTAWGVLTAPQADLVETSGGFEPQWAFVISGELARDAEAQGVTEEGKKGKVEDFSAIHIRNRRTNQVEAAQINGNTFQAAFVDMERRSVIKIGDKLEVAVSDSEGQAIGDAIEVEIRGDHLRQAYLHIPLRIGDLFPKTTRLLQNYPNPFNPETWLPYHLAAPAVVVITIYDVNGTLVRRLDIGSQPSGRYVNRSRAAYWDGRNDRGEHVASGVYFYHLSAGNYDATQRLVILK